MSQDILSTNKALGDIIMKLTIIMAVICIIVASCSYLNEQCGLKDDHILEQGLEMLIQDQTGLNIDLTP